MYNLTGRNYTKFEGYIGIADEVDPTGCGNAGSAIFIFSIDDNIVYASNRIYGATNGENTPPIVKPENMFTL